MISKKNTSVTRPPRRLPYISVKLAKKVEALGERAAPIKTHERSATIIPPWIGRTFLVHNGKKYIPVHVSEVMVGQKLGAFSPTRTFTGHGSNRKGDGRK